jgi:hypothetical protein
MNQLPSNQRPFTQLLQRNPVAALAFLFLTALLASCSSTGGGQVDSVGLPARIRFVSMVKGVGNTFELLNETHTNRVELYSTARANANVKVQTDEVLDEVLVHFARLGLNERTQSGSAPPSSSASLSSVEIEVAGNTTHLAVGSGSSVEDRTLYTQCFQTFLLVYNQTYQLQSVEHQPGWSPSLPTR